MSFAEFKKCYAWKNNRKYVTYIKANAEINKMQY